jgi:hypothetical protein
MTNYTPYTRQPLNNSGIRKESVDAKSDFTRYSISNREFSVKDFKTGKNLRKLKNSMLELSLSV